MTTDTAPRTGAEPCATTGDELRRAATRDILAVSPGIIPFGVTLGITVVATGTGKLNAVLGAALVFGGSAQLTTITVLHIGAGLFAAVLSGIIVNARILLYGAALEPWFRDQPQWFRLLGPHFIQDQTYLSASVRTGYSPAEFRRYWGWLGSLLLAVWTGSVVLGLLAAPLLPPLPHLGLVGAALFVAMLVPRLVDRTSTLTAALAAGTALAVSQVVPTMGILGGASAGVLLAMLTREGIMTTLVAMLILGAVCWVFRILLIALVPAERLPTTVRQALGHLPPAVLGALVAVDTAAASRGSDPLVAVLVVGSLAAAGLAVRLTGSLLLGIGIGVGAALFIDLLILA